MGSKRSYYEAKVLQKRQQTQPKALQNCSIIRITFSLVHFPLKKLSEKKLEASDILIKD